MGSSRHSFSDTKIHKTSRPLGSQAWRLSTGMPIHTNRYSLVFIHMSRAPAMSFHLAPLHRYKGAQLTRDIDTHMFLHPVGTNTSAWGSEEEEGACLAQSLGPCGLAAALISRKQESPLFSYFVTPLVYGGQLPARPPPVSEAPRPLSPAGPLPSPPPGQKLPGLSQSGQALECDRAPG